jgi:hypothetical protein
LHVGAIGAINRHDAMSRVRKGTIQMNVFCVTEDNKIHVLASRREIPSAAEVFQNKKELGALAVQWPSSRLVEIWNQLANVRKVAKFTNRNTGVQRLWQALEGEGELKRHTRRVTAKQRGLNKPARSRPKTKTERMLALLDRPEGVSLQTLMKTTQWQAHSVRGFLSAQVTKRMGLKVNSFRREGQRVYAIDR